jgi:hypothetical protein
MKTETKKYSDGAVATGTAPLPDRSPVQQMEYLSRLEIERLRNAMKPFVDVAISTNGRIPHEKLSAANWHDLVKAYDA